MSIHFPQHGWDAVKKNDLKPHLQRTWCIPQVTSAFLANMEDILQLYARPSNPHEPVICYDERPCFLIGETLVPVPMQEGHPRKQQYAYEKLGSCALLAAIEPLTGRRLGQVQAQRTKREYTLFCQTLAAYPDATTIHLVQDNLNTHTTSAFYAMLPADEAAALAARFTFHYTPKGASWLNMIECEFSVISRFCLNRRIATIETLRTEVLAFLEERSTKQIRIHWQFSVQAARTKLNRHYTKVNPDNAKYKET